MLIDVIAVCFHYYLRKQTISNTKSISMAKILLVSRSPHNLAVALVRSGGHEPIEVLSFKRGLTEARELPYDSIIVAEYRNGDGEVPEFMDNLWEAGIHHRVIVHSERCNAVELMKVHDKRLFATYLQTATFDQTLLKAIDQYLPGLHDREILPGNLFQQHGVAADKIMSDLNKVAPLEVPVTVSGEPGLGKERIAQAVHENSSRNRMPITFVRYEDMVLDSSCHSPCGECFLEKCFRENQGGTLVLIDLPNFCQKDQAVLRSRMRDPSCNVRIIATADKRMMKAKVESGEFNCNLWFELSKGMIEIPPLRDCPDNIEWLAKKLLEHFCVTHNLPKLIITNDAIMVLKAFAWPGNVMQLNAVLVRKAVQCEKGVIDADDFIDLIEVDEVQKGETLFDRFIRVLKSSPTVAIAAKRLGKSVRTLYNWITALSFKNSLNFQSA